MLHFPPCPTRWTPGRGAQPPWSVAVIDLVEAVLLQGREGEQFDAVVIDDGLVQLRDPAVRAKVVESCPPPGSEICVRLERADPAMRTVTLAVA